MAPSGFSFGATTPAATATPSTGFSFGATPAAATTAASTGFSFGATPATSTATTPAPATGFSFGGAAGTTTPAPAAGSTGFSFGGTTPAATTAAPAASAGFSFGTTPAAAPATSTTSTGFGFGTTPAATPATSTASTGFGFGAAATTTPAASSGFSFGATAAKPAATSAFGATTPAASTGFSFGSTTAKPATGGFGFGASTTQSTGFGSTPSGTSAFGGSLFGSTATPAATTTSGFGGFGAATTQVNSFGVQQAGQPGGVSADSPTENLNAIKMAYQDPQQSRFKHMFYNVVDPNQRHLYVRPSHISERLWKQAETDNPDPANCVPAAVVGFKELTERIEMQQAYAQKLNTFVEGLRATLEAMEKSTRSTDSRLQKCRHEHLAISHKLLQIMRKVEVYQCLRKPLHPEELRLRDSLIHLQNLLNRPDNFKARLNEIVSLQRIQEEASTAGQKHLSAADLETVYGILDHQSKGLKHLNSILTQDLRDVEIMKKGLHQKNARSMIQHY